MNKITKYVTTGAAALLMLMSVGTAQSNVNASKRNYRAHVTRNVKKNIKQNKKGKKVQQRQSNRVNRKKTNPKKQNQKRKRVNKRNKRTLRTTINRYKKTRRNRKNKRATKRVRRYARRLKNNRRNRRRRNRANVVLKPRYRVVQGNKKGNRELDKSGFYFGEGLADSGYSQNFRHYVFSKYAPNDKRAVIPSNLNPKMQNYAKKHNILAYRNINNYLWVQGYFSLTHPRYTNTNHNVYKYYPKLHGWKLAPRY